MTEQVTPSQQQHQLQSPTTTKIQCGSSFLGVSGDPNIGAANAEADSKTQLQINQENLPYKNRLQEFAQRARIQLPSYQTVNEGPSHAPKFKSTVVVDGITYTSVNTFSSRKSAEQDVAKVALEEISRKIHNWVSNKMNKEGFTRFYEEKIICKSILHEFAAKMNLKIPKYNTVMVEGVLSGFVSSVVFGGVAYTGEACKSKKEAEQSAAREVILSILGNLGLATILPEIIKSKDKCFLAAYKQSCSDVGLAVAPVKLDLGNSTGNNAAPEGSQASDIQPLGVSVTKEAAFGDKDSNKAGNLIGNAASEVHEGKASDVHSLTVSATREDGFGDKDDNKATNHAAKAPEGQDSDEHSLQIPNLDILTRNKKRKARRKKGADKKLKTEVVRDLSTVQEVSEGAK